MNCEFCQSPVHIWFQCPKKPDGWKPARLATKSTAALKEVQRQMAQRAQPEMGTPDCTELASRPQASIRESAAGTQALPVDTPKRGRPSTGFDKRAYNRQYMADRRAGKR